MAVRNTIRNESTLSKRNHPMIRLISLPSIFHVWTAASIQHLPSIKFVPIHSSKVGILSIYNTHTGVE